MKNIFLIAIASFLFSCSTESKKPQDLISKTDMVSIISDIHMLEAKLIRLRVKKDSLRKVYNAFERALFKEHGTTKEVYERSYAYYTANPELLESIYEIAVDSLNVLEQQATMEKNLAKEAAEATDSIKRAEIRAKKTLKRKPIENNDLKIKD
ncbi:MAG: DUF4296 domain-containing protein [Reichenbachiella sp.]